jgi:hypothetical protein
MPYPEESIRPRTVAFGGGNEATWGRSDAQSAR